MRAPTACRHRTCPNPAQGHVNEGFCAEHNPGAFATSLPKPAGWTALAGTILARDPWCRACHAAPSQEVNHIVGRKQGGSDDPSNLEGLCRPCHALVTAAQAAEGRRLARP